MLVSLPKTIMKKLLIFNYLFVICYTSAQYEVPDALVEPLSPRGFRISIPDEDGIKLFAFHGKINEEMEGHEGGTFSRDILKAKNGRWTFVDKITKLKPGDIIYYWTYVDYFDGQRKLGYINDGNMFVVNELIHDNPAPTTAKPTTTTKKCHLSETLHNGQQACENKVIFHEKFLNTFWTDKKWQVDVRFADIPDYEFVHYTNDRRVIYIDGNVLNIKPTLTNDIYGADFIENKIELDLGTNCTGTPGATECIVTPKSYIIVPPIVSGAINTKKHFTFKYGIVEVRAKLPQGDWIYPEIYLNPVSHFYGAGYDSGQIRIAFVKGNEDDNGILEGGCILGDSTSARQYAIKRFSKTNIRWSDDFHIFTVRWEPERVTMLVDHEEYGHIYPSAGGFSTLEKRLQQPAAKRWKAGTVFAPFDQDMYVHIGVGVGGHNFFDSDNKPWSHKSPKEQKEFFNAQSKWHETWSESSSLQVDYIKVTSL